MILGENKEECCKKTFFLKFKYIYNHNKKTGLYKHFKHNVPSTFLQSFLLLEPCAKDVSQLKNMFSEFFSVRLIIRNNASLRDRITTSGVHYFPNKTAHRQLFLTYVTLEHKTSHKGLK